MKRFEGRWTQVEYGHPLRSNFEKLQRAYLLKVTEATKEEAAMALFVTWDENTAQMVELVEVEMDDGKGGKRLATELRPKALPQATVAGTQPSQSNQQAPPQPTVQASYTIIALECENVIGISTNAALEYFYRPDTLGRHGTHITKAPKPITDITSFYHQRHSNWEAWEKIFQATLREDLVRLGLEEPLPDEPEVPAAPAVKEVPVAPPEPNTGAPAKEPDSEVVTGHTEKLAEGATP
jgi:hypothetical protein